MALEGDISVSLEVSQNVVLEKKESDFQTNKYLNTSNHNIISSPFVQQTATAIYHPHTSVLYILRCQWRLLKDDLKVHPESATKHIQTSRVSTETFLMMLCRPLLLGTLPLQGLPRLLSKSAHQAWQVKQSQSWNAQRHSGLCLCLKTKGNFTGSVTWVDGASPLFTNHEPSQRGRANENP